jgi:hypothetical protein
MIDLLVHSNSTKIFKAYDKRGRIRSQTDPWLEPIFKVTGDR